MKNFDSLKSSLSGLRSAAWLALALGLAACGVGGDGGGSGGGTGGGGGGGGTDPGKTVSDANGQPVTFAVTSGGGNVTSASRITNIGSLALPPGLVYPNGVFTFEVTGVASGGTVTVRVQLPAGSNPTQYIKCNASNVCTAFTGASISGNTITLTLTDNGSGDNDNTAGTITDPGAPARPAASSCNGDDCRRAVLKDIGEEIILPALRDFDTEAATLKTAADAFAATPGSTPARDNVRAAWTATMASWQRNEVLQVGPAGRSTGQDMVIGGQDLRDRIYSWPVTLNICGLEAAADSGAAVDANTAINITGLGALEHLLFTAAAQAGCAQQPSAAERAVHVQKLAAWLAQLATALRNRWEPANGNYIQQWSTAGAGSTFYMTPQAGLNALSIGLFYVEKTSKDRKIALTTGIGASGLTCGNPASCPEFLESRLARESGANLQANVQAFKDIFTGINGKLGMNDLLEGIGRSDLATEIVSELDAVLAQLATIESGQRFDAAVEGITSRSECINASSSSSGLPPCALHGMIKTAMDTFRGPIVGALSLAVPSGAAGDND